MGDSEYSFTTQREEFCKSRGIPASWKFVERYIETLEQEKKEIEGFMKEAVETCQPVHIDTYLGIPIYFSTRGPEE